jgi:hypothetical protein
MAQSQILASGSVGDHGRQSSMSLPASFHRGEALRRLYLGACLTRVAQVRNRSICVSDGSR